MLKEITPKYDATPNTPMSEDFRKVIDGPAADYHRPGAEQYKSGVIPHKNLVYCKKSRKTHSAPIKRMGGKQIRYVRIIVSQICAILFTGGLHVVYIN